MICQNCKAEYTGTHLFCGHCGEMTPPPVDISVRDLERYIQTGEGDKSNALVNAERVSTVKRLSDIDWGQTLIVKLIQGSIRRCWRSVRMNLGNTLSAWREQNQQIPRLGPLCNSKNGADRSTGRNIISKLFPITSMEFKWPPSPEQAIAASRLEVESLDRMIANAQTRKAELVSHIAKIVEDDTERGGNRQIKP